MTSVFRWYISDDENDKDIKNPIICEENIQESFLKRLSAF